MLPWPRSVLLRGPRSGKWRPDDGSPLSRLQLQAAPLAASRALALRAPPLPVASRVLTTGPTQKQRPGITSPAPLTHLPPSRSRMASAGPGGDNNDDGFDIAGGVVLPSPYQPSPPAPLSVLPLKVLLRSLLVNTVSCSKPLLLPSMFFLSVLASSQGTLLNPDKNAILRYVIKRLFYAQFCAGENRAEVGGTISELKQLGYSGVILNYAREAVAEESHGGVPAKAPVEEESLKEVTPWAEGTMETITMAQPGDFVALKFTGAGRQALLTLAERQAPPPALANAIDSICDLAASRGVRLLFDAEQASLQPGIDAWTLEYMRKYNHDRVCVYGTYQAYLKGCANILSEHLRLAQEEGFQLGVKLVRGAYINSDPRHLIHDTKADTDNMYDGITKAILKRTWDTPLTGSGEFPITSLVVASHNADSVKLAREMVERGEAKSEVDFAQLMGMADEISTTLLPGAAGPNSPGMKAYKYVSWGTTGECMKYLLRRAYENRDAVARTREGRDAMGRELVRRVKAMFGV